MLLSTGAVQDAAGLSPNTMQALIGGNSPAFSLRPPSETTAGGHKRWCFRDAAHVALAGVAPAYKLPLTVGLRIARTFIEDDEAWTATGNSEQPFLWGLRRPCTLFDGGRSLLVAFGRNDRWNVHVPDGVIFDLSEFRRHLSKSGWEVRRASLVIECNPIIERVIEKFEERGENA